MIVKNEARLISQCLQSVAPIVDQMVVVDTGSEDETVALAQAAGAEVYHHEWEGNFAQARNHSLSYAKGRWILILDGDEVLDSKSINELRQLDLSDQAPEAYQFKIVNFTTDEARETEAGLQDQVRLFKRHPQHAYNGLVHNQLMYLDQKRNLHGPLTTIRILHYGYTPTVWKAQAKDLRLTLLIRAVEDQPDSAFVYYNLGNHLKILKRYEEAFINFTKAIPNADDAPSALEIWQLSSCFLGAFCANQIGLYQEAIHLSNLAIHLDPHLIDAQVRKAEAQLSLKQYRPVIDQLSLALSDPKKYAVKQKSLYFFAPYRLARALFVEKHYAEALVLFLSLSHECTDITVYTHLCLCACYQQDYDIYQYARKRGALLDAHDIDWPIVDRVYTNTLWGQKAIQTLDVYCWVQGKNTADYLLVLTTDETIQKYNIICSNTLSIDQQRSLYFVLQTQEFSSQLSCYLGKQLLYTAPALFPVSMTQQWQIGHMLRLYIEACVS